MIYFGFAVADSMFPAKCEVTRQPLTMENVKSIIQKYGVTPCLNPSHKPTIDAMRLRYGINLPIPETAPQVKLKIDDGLIVMSVRGLPRLEGRREYTEEEIATATFEFGGWTIRDPENYVFS